MEVDAGVHTRLRGDFLPVLIDCCTLRNKISAMAPPTKEGLAIFKVARTTSEGNIACNEINCVAFMLYMGIGLGEKQSCKT